MSEEGILANLKKENRALWMRLNQVEENAKTDCKKVMNILKNFLKLISP
jgi:hypothetical protein